MGLPTDFFSVWTAISLAITGKTITANSKVIGVPASFFNVNPEFRNKTPAGGNKDFNLPTITLKAIAPSKGDFIVNESLNTCVTVTAATAYLDGMRVPTVVLADGQTLILRVGFLHGLEYVTQDYTATFNTADFVDIANATLIEVAESLENQLSAQGALVHVHIIPANGLIPAFIRIEHQIAYSYGSLQILPSSTAVNFIALFPSYEVAGRDAGTQIMTEDPPEYYDFDFSLIVHSKRFDHHMFATKVVEQMFKIIGSPNQRAISVDGNLFGVVRNHPIDDPLPREGVFITTTPFVLQNVPILASAYSDLFNGGNWGGDGSGNVAPPVTTFEFRVAIPAAKQELVDIPDAEFELILMPVT